MTFFLIFLAVCVVGWLVVAWSRTTSNPRTTSAAQQEEADVALGLVAPIAAALVTGEFTATRAEQEVRKTSAVAPMAMRVWSSMTDEERAELGANYIKVMENTDLASLVEQHLAPLKDSDPELWKESMAKAKKALGRTPTGGQG